MAEKDCSSYQPDSGDDAGVGMVLQKYEIGHKYVDKIYVAKLIPGSPAEESDKIKVPSLVGQPTMPSL